MLSSGADEAAKETSKVPPKKGGGVTKATKKMAPAKKTNRRGKVTTEESFEPTETWYEDAASYWAKTPPTVDGVLGGFAELSEPDAKGSKAFIEEYVSGDSPRLDKNGIVCDCGAGIGRVSKVFLLPTFQSVDLVEQDPAFLKTAETEYLKEFGDRVQKYICQGLQDFVPEAGRYEAIWAQWCLGHLTDSDLVAFFVRCKRGVKPNGMIFVKENITRKFTIDMDESDSSVTRSDEILKGIFEKAGLRILKEKEQDGFPTDIFPVKMYALESIKD